MGTKRLDIDNSKGLVWAITEQCLPNFLTPRDCPRVSHIIQPIEAPKKIKSDFSQVWMFNMLLQ
ncbi:DUF6886 family protein [Mobilitalea sibirica]|uniref:DUF6886 family protein n=1 Tax=Mobilitalea sibirica TaxID=1462919 RepID=UPI0038CBF65E